MTKSHLNRALELEYHATQLIDLLLHCEYQYKIFIRMLKSVRDTAIACICHFFRVSIKTAGTRGTEKGTKPSRA